MGAPAPPLLRFAMLVHERTLVSGWLEEGAARWPHAHLLHSAAVNLAQQRHAACLLARPWRAIEERVREVSLLDLRVHAGGGGVSRKAEGA